MKSLFDKLNLRPQERRLVVIVGLVIFIVLNIWFIWPYFDDWGQLETKMHKSQQTLKRYQDEINRRTVYEARLKELEKTGSQMLNNELELQRIIQTQAAASGLQITSSAPQSSRSGTRTNQFFQEQAISIQYNSGGKELVDFLVGIASQDSMIRVRQLDIKPDQSQLRLTGNLILVGNYQKKATNTQNVATSPRRRT